METAYTWPVPVYSIVRNPDSCGHNLITLAAESVWRTTVRFDQCRFPQSAVPRKSPNQWNPHLQVADCYWQAIQAQPPLHLKSTIPALWCPSSKHVVRIAYPPVQSFMFSQMRAVVVATVQMRLKSRVSVGSIYSIYKKDDVLINPEFYWYSPSTTSFLDPSSSLSSAAQLFYLLSVTICLPTVSFQHLKTIPPGCCIVICSDYSFS